MKKICKVFRTKTIWGALIKFALMIHFEVGTICYLIQGVLYADEIKRAIYGLLVLWLLRIIGVVAAYSMMKSETVREKDFILSLVSNMLCSLLGTLVFTGFVASHSSDMVSNTVQFLLGEGTINLGAGVTLIGFSAGIMPTFLSIMVFDWVSNRIASIKKRRGTYVPSANKLIINDSSLRK